MALQDVLFEYPFVYRWFHRVFSGSKHHALSSHLSAPGAGRPRRVLDLGCGPGQDAVLFRDRSRYKYLGVDINPKYVAIASKVYGMDFRVADVTDADEIKGAFDIVLMNSLIHHLSPEEAHTLLTSARGALAEGGECLVLDMIYPAVSRPSNRVNRLLIDLDRGRHCRSERELDLLLREYFDVQAKHSFAIKMLNVLLWDLRLYVCKLPGGDSNGDPAAAPPGPSL